MKQILQNLKSGKHVFVEKPPCLNEFQLNEIVNLYSKLSTVFCAFNRDPFL